MGKRRRVLSMVTTCNILLILLAGGVVNQQYVSLAADGYDFSKCAYWGDLVNRTYEIQTFDDERIPCFIKCENYEGVEYQWYFEKDDHSAPVLLFSGDRLVTQDQNFKYDNVSDDHALMIFKMDKNYIGNYRCKTNRGLETIQQVKPLRPVEDYCRYAKPDPNVTYPVKEKRGLRLPSNIECSLFDYTTWTWSWESEDGTENRTLFEKGVQIEDDLNLWYDEREHALIIHKARKEDGGYYTYEIKNYNPKNESIKVRLTSVHHVQVLSHAARNCAGVGALFLFAVIRLASING